MTTTILQSEKLTPASLRYWAALARKNDARQVQIFDVIDPFRVSLQTLRATLPAGTRVYRASTGGKYGKSSQIVSV